MPQVLRGWWTEHPLNPLQATPIRATRSALTPVASMSKDEKQMLSLAVAKASVKVKKQQGERRGHRRRGLQRGADSEATSTTLAGH